MLLGPHPGVRQRVLLTDETPEMHGFYESLGFVTSQQVGLTAFYYINSNRARGSLLLREGASKSAHGVAAHGFS